jgi:hypothetical protein
LPLAPLLSNAPLSNVTLRLYVDGAMAGSTSTTTGSGSDNQRRLQGGSSALTIGEDSGSDVLLVFTPDDFHVVREVPFALVDQSLCTSLSSSSSSSSASSSSSSSASSDASASSYASSGILVELSSADPHYNSSLNNDPNAVAGYRVPVRCYGRPRVTSLDPPASHMQGGDRVRVLGDGFRDELTVWLDSRGPASQGPRECLDVVISSDAEATCTLPSAQYGYADVLLQVNTSASSGDVLFVNASDPVDNNFGGGRFGDSDDGGYGGAGAAWFFFERRCESGYDLLAAERDDLPLGVQEEVCLPCSLRTFSPYGIKCAACPDGAECAMVEEILEGTFLSGSAVPVQKSFHFRPPRDEGVFGRANET